MNFKILIFQNGIFSWFAQQNLQPTISSQQKIYQVLIFSTAKILTDLSKQIYKSPQLETLILNHEINRKIFHDPLNHVSV